MTTILEYYEFFNIGGFDRWRNWGKMFRQNPWVHRVVVRKTNVKEKGKSSRRGDDTDVANPNSCPSVIYVKSLVWIWDPQGKPSSFQYEVPFVDVVTFLSKYGLIHFRSWNCPLVNGFYSELVSNFQIKLFETTDVREPWLEGEPVLV